MPRIPGMTVRRKLVAYIEQMQYQQGPPQQVVVREKRSSGGPLQCWYVVDRADG